MNTIGAAILWMAGSLIGALGALLLWHGVLGDILTGARHRRRCPRCSYSMVSVTGLTCPECGHVAGDESRLHKPRRSIRWIMAGVLLGVLGVSLLVGPTMRAQIKSGSLPHPVQVWMWRLGGSAPSFLQNPNITGPFTPEERKRYSQIALAVMKDQNFAAVLIQKELAFVVSLQFQHDSWLPVWEPLLTNLDGAPRETAALTIARNIQRLGPPSPGVLSLMPAVVRNGIHYQTFGADPAGALAELSLRSAGTTVDASGLTVGTVAGDEGAFTGLKFLGESGGTAFAARIESLRPRHDVESISESIANLLRNEIDGTPTDRVFLRGAMPALERLLSDFSSATTNSMTEVLRAMARTGEAGQAPAIFAEQIRWGEPSRVGEISRCMWGVTFVSAATAEPWRITLLAAIDRMSDPKCGEDAARIALVLCDVLPDAVDAFEAALRSDEPGVRYHSIELFQRAAWRDADRMRAVLEPIAESDPNPAVRRAACEALRRRLDAGDLSALPKWQRPPCP